MKINRFLALAAIALLVVAAMGAVTAQSYAQTATPPASATVQTQQSEPAEAAGPDTDTAEQQVGDQSTADTGAEAATEADSGVNDQTPLYAGSITVSDTATAGQSESAKAAALAARARITIEQAKAAALAANPGATVVKAGLDNENGVPVYSVELSTGADVKVDAGTGAILHTDTGADNCEVQGGPDTDNVQEGQGKQVEDGQPDVPGAAEAPEAAPQSPAQ